MSSTMEGDTKPKYTIGYVPIKAEYVVKKAPTKPEPRAENESTDPRDNRNRKPYKNKKKRKRNRREEGGFIVREEQGTRLCFKLAHGKPCELGESCKFSHDIKEYFDKKPADISDQCPIYDAFGYCSTGFRCRFAGAHTKVEEDGSYTTLGDPAAGEKMPKTNLIDGETRKLLRSNKYFKTKRILAIPKVSGERVWECVSCHQKNNLGATTPCTKCNTAVSKAMPGVAPFFENEKVSDSQPIEASLEKAPDSLNKEPAVESQKEPALGISSLEKEVKKLVLDRKIFVAPLTTVGNLPFRRIVKQFGADITCGEMAMSKHLLSGHMTEWALTRRHPCEDVFGIQLAGNNEEVLGNAARLIANECAADFIDLNMGCPIDLVTDRGAGSKLMMTSPGKLMSILRSMTNFKGALPLGLKMRTGWNSKDPIAHKKVAAVQEWVDAGCLPANSIAYFSIHGRSRQQRYTRRADWAYIQETCNELAKARAANGFASQYKPVPLMGNGDVMSFTEWEEHLGRVEEAEANQAELESEVASEPAPRLKSCMVARGALVKPWMSTEIKERRHWDISASERFDILKDFVRFGLEHWGTDAIGVNTTRRMLLEWLSFLCRYVPVGLLDVVPQHIQDRPPQFVGRSDLETLLASQDSKDWIQISERLLGPVPEGFKFIPKHKANSYVDESEIAKQN